MTQPSLSSAIRQLEDQLGVQLVFRGSRFQGLTPEGQRVLDRALGIVGDVRALKDEMRVVRSGLSGNLRLGVIPTALPMVADLTGPFTQKHPNVRVSILSRTSVEILTGIEALDLEAGITYLDNEPLGRVSQVPLYTEFYRLLIAPGSDLASRRHVSWNELSSVPLCLLTSDMQNRRIVNQHLGEVGDCPFAIPCFGIGKNRTRCRQFAGGRADAFGHQTVKIDLVAEVAGHLIQLSNNLQGFPFLVAKVVECHEKQWTLHFVPPFSTCVRPRSACHCKGFFRNCR